MGVVALENDDEEYEFFFSPSIVVVDEEYDAFPLGFNVRVYALVGVITGDG